MESDKRFVVSVVMIKEIPKGFNTQNGLYIVDAVSREEAHGKVLPAAQQDFPEHRMHTIGSVEV